MSIQGECIAHFGNRDVFVIEFVEQRNQACLLFGFAVNDEGLFGGCPVSGEPGTELDGVGVRGKTVERFDMGLKRVHSSEDFDFGFTFDDSAAQGVHGLEAHDEDGIFRIADGVGQMMENSSCFAHAAGGDDDAGFIKIV